MNNPNLKKIIYFALLGVGVVGVGASVLVPVIKAQSQWDVVHKAEDEAKKTSRSSSSSSSNPISESSSQSISSASLTPAIINPKDEGTLVDHIFEMEDAEFNGSSQNSTTDYGHKCSAVSYFVDASLSNGICVRNTNSAHAENTFTFKFKSDKSYSVDVELTIAAKYASSKWKALF